jgi:hypothetical protein
MSDQLLAADSFTTSDLDKPVKLRLGEYDSKKYPPITVYTMFKQRVEERPDALALGFKPKSDPDRSRVELSYIFRVLCHV